MSVYRVEKSEQPVTVHLYDQGMRQGVVFLSPNSCTLCGAQSVLELLREKTRFLPFRNQQGELTLINKEVITYIGFQPTEDEIPPLVCDEVDVRIVFFGGELLEGTILLDQPAGKNRLLDYVNAFPGFFAVRGKNRRFVANGSMVQEVTPR
ncbi:MAG: hypothetical protein IH614_11035 [Desulfuromonadales bacterium]|nr:hypothetical protein [Desulfuromonadales bacterium]